MNTSQHNLFQIASTSGQDQTHAVICDFGLARNITESMTVNAMGTNIYIAPELLNVQPYNQKADVPFNVLTVVTLVDIQFCHNTLELDY
jgi:serine/threonine protein kinase